MPVNDVTPDAGESPRKAPGDAVNDRAVEALVAAIPVLVGVATRDRGVRRRGLVDAVPVAPRAAELGSTPSAVVAERLGSAPSSVTRLADRLEDSGHLVRHRERPNRSVVRLELTGAGRELVDRVIAARRRELTDVVDRLPAGSRKQVAAALEAVVAAAGRGPSRRPDRTAGAVTGTDNGTSAGSTRADPPRRRLPGHLGDFTVTPRVLVICAWALPVGAAGAGASWVLLRLIGLITNLVFFGRFSGETVSPGAGPHPWWLVLGAPIAGGLVVGVMARYGSEKIRGHGMPEAIEAILTRGSRVEPKVAVLKPVSAAVSIGTGGPFGAEGPIIMTGGALGSILAQYLHLSADERKALMVGGAAAGMAATFNAPLASVLLAVELLLFEWRPRSFLPVVAAVAVATLLRAPLLGSGPIFPVDVSGWHVGPVAEVLCVLAGGLGGLLAVVVTSLVYFSEDAFARLGSFRLARSPARPALDVVARDRRVDHRARRAGRAPRARGRLRRHR